MGLINKIWDLFLIRKNSFLGIMEEDWMYWDWNFGNIGKRNLFLGLLIECY